MGAGSALRCFGRGGVGWRCLLWRCCGGQGTLLRHEDFTTYVHPKGPVSFFAAQQETFPFI